MGLKIDLKLALGWPAGASLLLGPSCALALTPQDVSSAFSQGVGFCVDAGVRHATISQLPESERAGLVPADEKMRTLVLNQKGPLWDVVSGKGIVVVFEPQPGTCEVEAYGAPVEATFKHAIEIAKSKIKVEARPMSPGYDPIVFRLVDSETEGKNLTILLHGSEPGAPGHYFRFSRLSGVINYSYIEK